MKYMLHLAQNWLKVNFMSLKSAEKTTFPSDIPQKPATHLANRCTSHIHKKDSEINGTT